MARRLPPPVLPSSGPFATPGMAVARGGFTLVEVLVVLMLMTVFAAIAVPRYAASLNGYRLDAAIRRIIADIGLAQTRAKTSSASQTVRFDNTTASYELLGLSSPLAASNRYIVQLAQEPYAAALGAVTFGGSANLTFDGFGAPESGGTIVVQVGSTSRTITVDAASGRCTAP
jgi:prepilin-type N-terminal cleavage/methylation domain-containing protein